MNRLNSDISEGYKTTELGIFPQEWDIKELRHILIARDVRAIDLGITEDSKCPLLSLTREYGLIPQSERFIHRVAIKDTSNYKVVEKGWVVYNPYVIWEGAIHILRNFEKGLVSPVYPVWEIKDAIPFYIDPLLRTRPLISEYERYSSGAVNRRRSIKKEGFLSIKIAIPPLYEQKVIAHILQTIREAKEKTEEVIRATKELKKSMMKHLFTYGPVSPEETERVRLKETEIGMMPEGWKVVRLGDVIKEDIKNGAFIRREKFGHGTLFLNVADTYKSIKIRPDTLERVDCTEEDISSYGLRIGDLVYVRSSLKREGVGQCCLVGELREQSIFDCHLMRVRVQEENVLPPFLAYFSVSPMGKQSLIARSKTTTMTTINQDGLAGFLLPLPNVSAQHQIIEILSTIDTKIEAEENRKNALEGLFKTLLHDLMTAKIRINNLRLEA